jgi:hypothetical protein
MLRRPDGECTGEALVSFGNVIFLKRCCVWGQMHIRPGETCSRECRMMLAEFEDFSSYNSS